MSGNQQTGAGKLVVLGIQHTFVMFGATVLVPLLTGLSVGVTLFAAGIGTLLFHVLTKFKVPVFLGSSFALIPAPVAILNATDGYVGSVRGQIGEIGCWGVALFSFGGLGLAAIAGILLNLIINFESFKKK